MAEANALTSSGVSAEHVETVRLDLPRAPYGLEPRTARELEENLRAGRGILLRKRS